MIKEVEMIRLLRNIQKQMCFPVSLLKKYG